MLSMRRRIRVLPLLSNIYRFTHFSPKPLTTSPDGLKCVMCGLMTFLVITKTKCITDDQVIYTLHYYYVYMHP
ncbi:hypothetical protein LINPERPRIM_LOCUS3243 [Linum perenne]